MTRAAARAIDLMCVGALAVACAWQLHDLERVLDLAPWDEADYLRRGVALLWRGLPDAEWGPLYALWYFVLSRLQPDRIALFYLSYRLLIALPTLAIYVCARRLGASAAVSLLGGLLFLVSAAPHVLPRPTLLALVIILIGLTVSARARRPESFCAVMGLSLLLAALARPELFLSFVAVSGGLAMLLASRAMGLGLRASGKAQTSNDRPYAIRVAGSYVAACAAVFAVFGNPFGNQDNRRLYAFCQHFAVGEVRRTGLPIDPWAQCDVALQRAFGEVHSVAEAARKNPSAFYVHVTDNLRDYPEASIDLFLPGVDDAPRRAHAAALALVGAWLAWGLIRAAARRWSGGPRTGGFLSPAVLRVGLVLASILLPTLASAIVIQPRSHYLVLQGVLVPLFAVAWLSGSRPERRPLRWGNAIAAAGLAAAVTAAAPHLRHRSPDAPRLANLEVVRLLDSPALEVRPTRGFMPLGILEMDGGFDAYSSPRFRRVSPAERLPEESFRQFLERRGVQVIVLSPMLTAHHRLKGDPEFEAFLAAPETLGFSRRAADSADRVVLEKRATGHRLRASGKTPESSTVTY